MEGFRKTSIDSYKDFSEDFWSKGGDQLITELNKYAPNVPNNDVMIRKELRKATTRYYCISIDEMPQQKELHEELSEKLKIDNDDQSSPNVHHEKIPPVVVNEKWSLCKIGTTRSGPGHPYNRAKKLMKKICKTSYNASITFNVIKSALDVRPDGDVEIKIRSKMGFKVELGKENELGLPNHTEWVLVQKQFLKNIKGRIDKEGEQASSETVLSYSGDEISSNLPDLPNYWAWDNQDGTTKFDGTTKIKARGTKNGQAVVDDASNKVVSERV